MKKNILIFRSAVPVPHNSTAYRLATSLQAMGMDNYKQVSYSDVVVILRGDQVRSLYLDNDQLVPIQADLVYMQGFSLPDIRQFIAQYLHKNKIKFINSENLYNMPTSKLNQYYAFSQNKVPYPPTITACPPLFELALQSAGENFPLVVKSINGKRGEDNYLVRSSDELKKLINELDPAQPFALQPFIENDGDYRFIVCKNTIVICYKRTRSQLSADHRNNVSQGGRRTLITNIPKSHKKAAIRAAKVLKRELVGIDIVIGPDKKPYVLESNFSFGLKDEGDGIYEQAIERLAPAIHKL